MDHLKVVSKVIEDVVAPSAARIDENGAFPRLAIEALGKAGLLGLVSAKEVGGAGQGHRAAALVVEALAHACASTAMVVCMHYAAAAVIEAHGSRGRREAIARGTHLTTLAFSEVGSRSQFWAPLSTATPYEGKMRLDASKSWVTSAGEADSYVWSSRPVAGKGVSTLWFVPRDTPGLSIPTPFNGLGLRGNASSPVTAKAVLVNAEDRLGPDGGGFDIMMGVVLPILPDDERGILAGHDGGRHREDRCSCCGDEVRASRSDPRRPADHACSHRPHAGQGRHGPRASAGCSGGAREWARGCDVEDS